MKKIELVDIFFNSYFGDTMKILGTVYKKYILVSVHDENDGKYVGFKNIYQSMPNEDEVFNILIDFDNYDGGQGLLLSSLTEMDIKTLQDALSYIDISSQQYPNLERRFKEYLISIGFTS